MANHGARPPARGSYRERLWLPWWAWPLGLAIAAMAAAELVMGAPALRHPLLFAVVLGLATLGLAALCRIKISVADGVLRVADARLPLEFVAAATEVDPQTRRGLLGPDADPLAFVIQRPWVRGAVRVDLDDPADPTPYWLISTRRPAELAGALTAAEPTAIEADAAGTAAPDSLPVADTAPPAGTGAAGAPPDAGTRAAGTRQLPTTGAR